MDLQFDEQLDIWKAVHIEQRGVTGNQHTERDRHFAQVMLWHDELSEPGLNFQPFLPTEACTDKVSDRRKAKADSVHRLNGNAAGIRSDVIETGQRSPDAQHELYLEAVATQLVKEQELLALQQAITGREAALEAASLAVEEQRHALECKRVALDERERELHAQHEQWSREVAQREQALDCRERSLDELRDSLGELTDASRDEESEGDRSDCFEQISLEQMSDDDEQFDELVDRLVLFHHSKIKKWYMFWS